MSLTHRTDIMLLTTIIFKQSHYITFTEPHKYDNITDNILTYNKLSIHSIFNMGNIPLLVSSMLSGIVVHSYSLAPVLIKFVHKKSVEPIRLSGKRF